MSPHGVLGPHRVLCPHEVLGPHWVLCPHGVLGPYCVLGPHETLGPHRVLDPHVVLGLHRVLDSHRVLGPHRISFYFILLETVGWKRIKMTPDSRFEYLSCNPLSICDLDVQMLISMTIFLLLTQNTTSEVHESLKCFYSESFSV